MAPLERRRPLTRGADQLILGVAAPAWGNPTRRDRGPGRLSLLAGCPARVTDHETQFLVGDLLPSAISQYFPCVCVVFLRDGSTFTAIGIRAATHGRMYNDPAPAQAMVDELNAMLRARRDRA